MKCWEVRSRPLGSTRRASTIIKTDPHANHCNVEHVLAEGAQRLYLGHGGPVTREAVLRWRREWVDEIPRCPTGAVQPAGTGGA